MKRQHNKWRFAIGTTSRVPSSGGVLHYLIADFDDVSPAEIFSWIPWSSIKHMLLQRTQHGWHLYTDAIYSFNELQDQLELMGADPAWIRIGKERGYYFLADKDEIDYPYPVEHMVIYNGEKETQNSNSPRPPISKKGNKEI